MNYNQEVADREWRDRINEWQTVKWEGVGCAYCGSSDRMCYPFEGEPFPCPYCKEAE